MGKGDIAVQSSPESVEPEPTANACLIISLQPEVRAEFDATVPARHATELLVVVVVLLLGVIAPYATLREAPLAGISSTWIAALTMTEIVAATVLAIVMIATKTRK